MNSPDTLLQQAPARQSPPAKPLSPPLKLCIVRSHAHNYSETFIEDHIAYLSDQTEVLYGLPLPFLHNNDQPALDATTLEAIKGPLTDESFQRYSEALAAFLQSRRYEAVLCENSLMGARLYRACELAGIPYLVHFHGADAYVTNLLKSIQDGVIGCFLSARELIVVSRHMQEQLIRLGAPPAKVKLAPYGVELATTLARPDQAPPQFLAVGRFVAKKAPHLTLRAFATVLQHCPQAHLVFVGDGPLAPQCQELAHKWGIQDSVTFTGVLNRRAVSRLMTMSRAFVQHSMVDTNNDHEGLPLAILEAGAHALPVVATQHAGIPDVVLHEQHGYLVPEGDVEGMARQMIRLAREPAHARQLGQAYRKQIESGYTLDKSIKRLRHLIKNAAITRAH